LFYLQILNIIYGFVLYVIPIFLVMFGITRGVINCQNFVEESEEKLLQREQI